MALTRKLLEYTFTLGTGEFSNGSNVLTVNGLRSSARVSKAGGASMGTADITIYGMSLDSMNSLNTIGMQVTVQPRNSVVIQAGDEDGLSIVFAGTIISAWVDLQGAPDVCLRINAATGAADSFAIFPPLSFTGTVDVVTALQSLASSLGYAFQNNGVSGIKLQNSYFWGPARNQIKAICEHAHIGWALDVPAGAPSLTLVIWPPGGSVGTVIPLISKSTGMVLAPSFNQYGISVRTAYNPNVGFRSKIQVQSDLLPGANGTWIVYSLDHDLSSNLPNGPWFSDIGAYSPSAPAPPL